MHLLSTIIVSLFAAATEACSGLYARDVVPEWGYNPEDGAMMWYNMDPVKNKLVSAPGSAWIEMQSFKGSKTDLILRIVVWKRHPSIAYQSQRCLC
jgi:hypothetical protein